MFERHTDRSRRAVVLMRDEAYLLNHHYIGTEHVLLGLIREEHGIAAKILESRGITLRTAREQVIEIIGRGQEIPIGDSDFTPRAKKVFAYALREALNLDHSYIGPEHVLLGLIREGEGVGVRVLDNLGVELGEVRQRVLQLIAQESSTPQPQEPPVVIDANEVRFVVVVSHSGLQMVLDQLDELREKWGSEHARVLYAEARLYEQVARLRRAAATKSSQH